ncbi:MAG: arylsulfotransferase family protein [Hyphomicrobiales bacterium]
MERFFSIMERVSPMVLCGLLGATAAYGGFWPYDPYIKNALEGTQAIIFDTGLKFGLLSADIWAGESLSADRSKLGTGVTVSKPGQDETGLVLVTVGQSAKLINHKGDVLHEWSLPYGQLPPGNGRVEATHEDMMYWQRARVTPEGDLIVMVNHNYYSPDGLAIMRIDSKSTLKWVRYGHYNHDFDVTADGKIHVIWQDTRTAPPDIYKPLGTPILDEGVATLDADGKLLHQVSVLDGFARSRYNQLPLMQGVTPDNKPGDRMHNNNVDVLSEAQAKALPGAKAGDVLISMREWNSIAAMDPATGAIDWAMHGSFNRQHDPDLLPNGNIMLFDNMGDWQRNAASRVIEFNPKTEEIVWQFPAPGSHDDLWSRIRGEQQVLPNGNVLINETQGGRLLEVNRASEVVWEYRCPFTFHNEGKRLCNLMSSQPYAEGDLPFLANAPLKLSTLN